MKEIYYHSRVLNKEAMTPEEILIVNAIEFKHSQMTLLIRYVRLYRERNLPLSLLVENWPKIQKLGRDSSSKESYILRYGQENGLKIWQEKTQKTSMTRDKWVSKYGEPEAIFRLKKRGASLENYIQRCGEIAGRENWKNYCEKRALAYEKNKAEGKQYAKYTREYYHQLHGLEKGNRIYDKKISAQRHAVSLEGYIEKFGSIDGPIRCRESKSRNLDFFLKKYGDQGHERYKQAQRKKAENRTGSCYSKWSIAVCEEIKKQIEDLHYYGDNEITISVYGIPEIEQFVIMPDIFYNGNVIEFQGDRFHANPLLHKASDRPHPFNKTLLAEDIWKKDRLRRQIYESKGYNVLEVWQSEWNDNQERVIDKCVKFLKMK